MIILVDATDYEDKGYELIRALAEVEFMRPGIDAKVTTVKIAADEDNNTVILLLCKRKKSIKTKIPFNDKLRRMSAVACQFAALSCGKDPTYIITESVFIREYVNKTVYTNVAEFVQKVLGASYPEVDYVDKRSSIYVAKFCKHLVLSKCCIKNIGKMLELPEKRLIAIVRTAEFERRTRHRYNPWVCTFEKIY